MMETRITARKNPFLQQVRKLLSSRKEREAAGLFVSDGTKLLQEAVRYWDGLDTVILSNGFLPLLGVAWLGDLCRNAICVLVCDECSVLVLCLHVSVDVLHEEKLLESNPLVEDLLSLLN